MLRITVKNGKLEPALKAYKRRVRQVKQLKRIREKEHFVKPSVKRRLELQRAKHMEKVRRSNS